MPRHPHPADLYAAKVDANCTPINEASYAGQAVGCTTGIETTLDLTVSISCPRPGALPQVHATGRGVIPLRDAVLEVVERNCGDGLNTRMAREICAIFCCPAPDCQVDKTELRAALNDVKQGLARALAQLPE